MDDRERPQTVSGDRRDRRRLLGCVLLLLAVLAVVAMLVWIDSRHIREPRPGEAVPAEVPPEAVPPPPPPA